MTCQRYPGAEVGLEPKLGFNTRDSDICLAVNRSNKRVETRQTRTFGMCLGELSDGNVRSSLVGFQ